MKNYILTTLICISFWLQAVNNLVLAKADISIPLKFCVGCDNLSGPDFKESDCKVIFTKKEKKDTSDEITFNIDCTTSHPIDMEFNDDDTNKKITLPTNYETVTFLKVYQNENRKEFDKFQQLLAEKTINNQYSLNYGSPEIPEFIYNKIHAKHKAIIDHIPCKDGFGYTAYLEYPHHHVDSMHKDINALKVDNNNTVPVNTLHRLIV